jgi:uncharacterized membrane protein
MSSDLALALSAFGIGVIAGLRSLTAPAVVSWAVHIHRLDLHDSRLAILGSSIAIYAISALGLGELIADKLSFVPDRTSPFPMAFRILSGAICGAAFCISANRLLLEGTLLGGARRHQRRVCRLPRAAPVGGRSENQGHSDRACRRCASHRRGKVPRFSILNSQGKQWRLNTARHRFRPSGKVPCRRTATPSPGGEPSGHFSTEIQPE